MDIHLGGIMKIDHVLESHYRLIFNVATPSYEEAWLEGYDSFQDEQDSNTNPYSASSNEYRYWNDGWWASFYGEEPLFTLSGTINPRAIVDPTTVRHALRKDTWVKRLFHVTCTLFAIVACYALIDNAS